MKLTKQTDFALRTLMYLATQSSGKRSFAQEISQAYDIPLNHLTKIVHKLSKLGYIKTYRGRNGGIELANPAESIIIRKVIEDFEPNLSPTNCQVCGVQSCCLQRHFNIAVQAFMQSLSNTTIADVIRCQ